jgi:hypothetical protein
MIKRSLTVEISKPRKTFEAIAEMIQNAVIADVVDKGDVPNKYKPGTTQHKAYFTWILEELDSEGRNKRTFQSFTVSLHEKATLSKLLKEFGVVVSKDAPFNLESLIGTQRLLILSQEDGDDGEPYTKILATKKSTGEVKIPADFQRKKDRA